MNVCLLAGEPVKAEGHRGTLSVRDGGLWSQCPAFSEGEAWLVFHLVERDDLSHHHVIS